MIVYHGTIMEIPQPKILRSEIGRGFGFAFYDAASAAQNAYRDEFRCMFASWSAY